MVAKQLALSSVRVVVFHDRGDTVEPYGPEATTHPDPNPGIRFDVAHIAGASPMLGDDPKGVAFQPLAYGSAPKASRVAARSLEDGDAEWKNPQRQQRFDRRVEDVALERPCYESFQPRPPWCYHQVHRQDQ